MGVTVFLKMMDRTGWLFACVQQITLGHSVIDQHIEMNALRIHAEMGAHVIQGEDPFIANVQKITLANYVRNTLMTALRIHVKMVAHAIQRRANLLFAHVRKTTQGNSVKNMLMVAPRTHAKMVEYVTQERASKSSADVLMTTRADSVRG